MLGKSWQQRRGLLEFVWDRAWRSSCAGALPTREACAGVATAVGGSMSLKSTVRLATCYAQ